MEFRRIEYFLVLAEKLNYTKAAEELFISPQALTKQIFILEEELGAKLFERTTRNVRLTEIGEFCKGKFLKVKEEMETAYQEVESFIIEKSNLLKIGFFTALPKNEIVMEVVNLIAKKYPKLEIQIFSNSVEMIKTLLIEKKIDLAITNAHDFEDWKEFERVNLKTMPAQIVISPQHKWANRKEITKAEMEEETILLLEKNTPYEFNSFYNNINAKKRHYSQDFDSMLATLELGRDYAVFPKMFNDMYKTDFKYIDLPESLKFYFRTMCVYKGDNPNKILKDIMEIIAKELGKDGKVQHYQP